MSRVYHDRSFLPTLALETKICVMVLLVLALLKFNLNLIKIKESYRLTMGSWSGVGASTILLYFFSSIGILVETLCSIVWLVQQ